MLPLLRHPLDLAYLAGLAAASPYWLLKGKARRKVLSALRDRTARDLPPPSPDRHTDRVTVLIHAVSLGEINATRSLVDQLLRSRDDLHLIISATTAAGYARARELYDGNPRLSVARYPLDLTASVERFLDHVRPSLVVLMELELWPNFLRVCNRRSIPVVLVNGRLTAHSLRRYRLILPLSRAMFRSLSALCTQDDLYRSRFLELGVDADKVLITGSMKFDTAAIEPDAKLMGDLRRTFRLSPDEQVLVAGSTGPGEEQLLLDVYSRLLPQHPRLRLLLVPRKPERFDEVAALIEGAGLPLLRRSRHSPDVPTVTSPIALLDSLGELRAAYALASVVVVGRTLLDQGPAQHGSDMIEPAALGKPVLVGPFTQNFADPMHLLRQHDAIKELRPANLDELPAKLTAELHRLLTNPAEALALGQRAADTVRQGQGATARNVAAILSLLPAMPTATRPSSLAHISR